MKAHMPSSRTAEHAGAVIGRAWRKWLRQEHRLIGWLISQGLSATAAKALLWIVKLVAFGVLLYEAFWLALLVVFAVAAAGVARYAGEKDDLAWRDEEVDHRRS